MKNSVVLSILLALLTACGSGRSSPDCITKKEKDLVLSWGRIDNTTGETLQYSVNSDCILYKVTAFADSGKEKIFSDSVRVLPENYCRTKQRFTELAASTQALWFPGETQIFIEYVNQSQNVYFRATWNPEFTNYGNKALRGFYDSLMYKLTVEKL